MLLASGAAIPISQLKVGDMVLATNVRTGKTQAETVTAVLVRHDKDRYDLRIRSRHRTAVIDTTYRHLFFDLALHKWVKAGALRYGDHLRAPYGKTAAIVIGGWEPRNHDGRMWDLTIPGNNDHDFYIDTSAGSVLVHNTVCTPEFKPWKKKLYGCIAAILFGASVHYGAMGDPPSIGGFTRPTPTGVYRPAEIDDPDDEDGGGGC